MKKIFSLLLLITSFLPFITYASGTIWEDMHVVAKKHCPDIADVMSIEDFDEFAAQMYITPRNASHNTPDFNKEIAAWVCDIKHYQSQQNYLTMISAQELGIKPLALPLLQLDKNIVLASHCLTSLTVQKSTCPGTSELQKKSHIISITESRKLREQDEKSLIAANINIPFHQSRQILEEIALLLLQQGRLTHADTERNEVEAIRKKISEKFTKLSELQVKIDNGLDIYKHKLDIKQ
jgi:hypothetical protein